MKLSIPTACGSSDAPELDVDIGAVTARAARGASAPAPVPGTWFEARTPFGPLRLGAFGTSSSARHATHAALALQRCEELLGALDAWSGLDLAWRWAGASASRAVLAPGARIWWRQCMIESPWALLRSLAAPDDALARQLQWSAVAAVLSLAQLRLGPDALALLEPGGAALLPQSLQPPWCGTLRSAGESNRPGPGVPVALHTPCRPRVLKARAHGGAEGTDTEPDDEGWLCEVRLALPHAVCGSLLTGWFDAELGAAGPQASLWRCARDAEPALCLAIGRLMPWGDGWALALDTVWEGAEKL